LGEFAVTAPGLYAGAGAFEGSAADAYMFGRRGGTIIDDARFAELQELYRNEHNVILSRDIAGKELTGDKGALYRAYSSERGPSFMYVKPDVTEYELAHETFHMFHHTALGSDYFMPELSWEEANVIREQYVYDRMIEPSTWSGLTQAEQRHAVRYIQKLGGDTRGITLEGNR
jgi:hypothetical protein